MRQGVRPVVRMCSAAYGLCMSGRRGLRCRRIVTDTCCCSLSLSLRCRDDHLIDSGLVVRYGELSLIPQRLTAAPKIITISRAKSDRVIEIVHLPLIIS